MNKMNVLLLGWEFPPVINGEVGNSCFKLTKTLAGRVNLSLILPKSDPDFILKNVDLTGLNNVSLQATDRPAPKPVSSAFSEEAYIRNEIVPYGAATPTLVDREPVYQPAPQPGELASVGNFGQSPASPQIIQEVEELYVFGQKDLSLVDYNSQVIYYARYASRLASQKSYEVIYAYDWMTFLAGIELKLVSGKPLVLHMHSLSYDRGGPDAKGWVYELEKQALEKADAIIAVTDRIARVIEDEYGIAASKITSLKVEKEEATETPEEQISDEIYNMEVSESNNDLVKSVLPVKEEATGTTDWEKVSDTVWQVLQGAVYQERLDTSASHN